MNNNFQDMAVALIVAVAEGDELAVKILSIVQDDYPDIRAMPMSVSILIIGEYLDKTFRFLRESEYGN
jgi:hypothetical protein